MLNPSDLTHEDFLIERALQMRGDHTSTLLQDSQPTSEEEKKPIKSDEDAQDCVIGQVKLAYVDKL